MAGTRTASDADRLLKRFHESASAARGRGLSRRLIEDDHIDENVITLDGARLVNFSSCSYLGLGTDPRLQEASIEAVHRFGTSYSSSPAYTAVPLYGELTERLGRMFRASAVLAPTTTLAHLSALPLLARKGDAVLIDAAAHASLQMATSMLVAAGVDVRAVPHSETAALEHAVTEAESRAGGRIWFLADGVYSMRGDTAPFEQIFSLLDLHPRLHVYYDDAHGFSWQGLNGCGAAVDATGWHPRMVVAVGFAKSFGTVGGAVASPDPELIDLIELCGAPLSFGGPITPAALGAGIASADIHLSDEHPILRTDLIRRIGLVDAIARGLGIPLAPAAVSPIRFVEVGSTAAMFEVIEGMKADGFYLNGAMFPIVPQGRAGVRFTVTRVCTESQIDAMLARLAHHLRRVLGEPALLIDLRETAGIRGDVSD